MTGHCSTCTCHDLGEAFAPRPAASSPGIRRAVIEQTAAEVRRAKEQRIAEAKAAAAKDREDRGRC